MAIAFITGKDYTFNTKIDSVFGKMDKMEVVATNATYDVAKLISPDLANTHEIVKTHIPTNLDITRHEFVIFKTMTPTEQHVALSYEWIDMNTVVVIGGIQDMSIQIRSVKDTDIPLIRAALVNVGYPLVTIT